MSETNAPEPRGPLGRRPLPARSDWRRALDVYRAGKSRAITLDEKRGLAGSAPDVYAEGPGGGRATGGGAPAPGSGPAAESEVPGYGVPVPEVLAFHRNASTWRNHLPAGRSGNDGRR